MTVARLSIHRFTWPVFFGILSALVAILCAYSDLKYAVGLLLVIIFGLTIAVLKHHQRLILLTFLLVFTIPINLDVNFLVKKHVGGAASISISATLLVGIILSFTILWRRIYDSRLYFGTEGIALLMFMICGLISLINAAYPMFTLLEIIRFMMLGLIMITVLNISDENLLKKMAVFIAITVSFQAFIAILQFFTKSFPPPSIDIFALKTAKELFPGQKVHRAMGTLGHPNFLGYYLEMTLPLILGLFLGSWKFSIRLLSGFALILGTIALIFSKSRGAWVAYPFALVGTVFLTYGKSIMRKNIFVKVLCLAFVGMSLIMSFSPFIIERFVGKDYQAMAVRMPLNKAALSIISQFPVIGVGLNNFSEVFKTYDITGHSVIFRGYKHVVHNLYLLIATETGIVGLIAFLSIFAVPLIRAVKVFKHSNDEAARGIVAGAVMGICAHLIHGLIDPGFIVSPTASYLIFFSIGFIGAFARIATQRQY